MTPTHPTETATTEPPAVRAPWHTPELTELPTRATTNSGGIFQDGPHSPTNAAS